MCIPSGSQQRPLSEPRRVAIANAVLEPASTPTAPRPRRRQLRHERNGAAVWQNVLSSTQGRSHSQLKRASNTHKHTNKHAHARTHARTHESEREKKMQANTCRKINHGLNAHPLSTHQCHSALAEALVIRNKRLASQRMRAMRLKIYGCDITRRSLCDVEEQLRCICTVARVATRSHASLKRQSLGSDKCMGGSCGC